VTVNENVFVHSHAICDSTDIGAGTRVWAFAHVLAGARLGENCNICDHVFIENNVVVGNNVTVKCGVQLWDGVRLGDNVFIGPNVTFTNDIFPRSKQYPEKFLETVVEQGASIGANATILPGIRIGRNAMIGAGAVVTKRIPPNAIAVGNPATVVGFVSSTGTVATDAAAITETQNKHDSRTSLDVAGCELWRFSRHGDPRGSLVAIEHGKDLPFRPQRTFLIYGVPEGQVRGEHAHLECHQLLIAVQGQVTVVVDDGVGCQGVLLSDPSVGLYIPPMTWGTLYDFTPATTVAVYASLPFNTDDYIRDYDQFLAITGRS
jgi:UDP-2-acetamido-3-amino-2,3-dideoxy-glucuronate N-acetyltransferase